MYVKDEANPPKLITCSLCLAGNKAEEVAGVFTHVVENMTEDGRPQLVVCADSSLKPPNRLVAPRG